MTPARTTPKPKRRRVRAHLPAAQRVAAARVREQEREPAPLWRTFAVCALLAGVTVALYSPVIAHPFINYDDPTYVSENPQVQEGLSWHTVVWALTATEHANWHPLTWISHALDCQVYGLAAAGQPVINQLRSPQKRAAMQSAVLCPRFNEIKLLAQLRINPPLTNGC